MTEVEALLAIRDSIENLLNCVEGIGIILLLMLVFKNMSGGKQE